MILCAFCLSGSALWWRSRALENFKESHGNCQWQTKKKNDDSYIIYIWNILELDCWNCIVRHFLLSFEYLFNISGSHWKVNLNGSHLYYWILVIKWLVFFLLMIYVNLIDATTAALIAACYFFWMCAFSPFFLSVFLSFLLLGDWFKNISLKSSFQNKAVHFSRISVAINAFKLRPVLLIRIYAACYTTRAAKKEHLLTHYTGLCNCSRCMFILLNLQFEIGVDSFIHQSESVGFCVC